jgi:hypothetical protein
MLELFCSVLLDSASLGKKSPLQVKYLLFQDGIQVTVSWETLDFPPFLWSVA